MLNWFLNWISGDYNKKKIKEFMPLVHDANHRCQEYNGLSIEDFSKKTQEFKDRILAGTSLDDLLPEAF
jgi:preprotein translocase subunit SecA